MRKKINRIVQLFLLSLSIGYFTTITSFPHVHEEGAHILVHTHPFSDGTDAEHPIQKTIPHGLQQFCNLLFIQISTILLTPQIETVYQYLSKNFLITPFLQQDSPYSLRAPPIC